MKTPQTPLESIDLELLLEQIRLRSISVGTMELQRLQTIFKHSPQLSRAELSDLLCTVLAKDTNQQLTIERVFQRWIPFDSELTPKENPNETQQIAGINKKQDNKVNEKNTHKAKKKSKPKNQNIAFIGLASLLSMVILAVLITLINTEEQAETASNAGATSLQPDPSPHKGEAIKPIDSKLKLQ